MGKKGHQTHKRKARAALHQLRRLLYSGNTDPYWVETISSEIEMAQRYCGTHYGEWIGAIVRDIVNDPPQSVADFDRIIADVRSFNPSGASSINDPETLKRPMRVKMAKRSTGPNRDKIKAQTAISRKDQES